MGQNKISTLGKFWEILKHEKEQIHGIYYYAIFSGLVQLSLPLGIQAIISFVLGGTISTSLFLLIILVILGVFVAGLLQVNQMKLIEKIQQQLFVRYSFQYAYIIPKIKLSAVDGYYMPELVNRFFDTISLQKGISKLLLDIPAATIQIIFGLILLSFYHPIFILFGFSVLLVVYLILRFTASRGMQTSLSESDFKYKVLGHLEDLARSVNTFKFAKNPSFHLKKTDEYVTGYLQSRTAHFKILLFQYWTLIGLKLIITSAMLLVGVYLLVNQQLSIGQFISAEIVILLVISSVEKLIINLDKVYDVMTSVEKVSKVIEKPMEVETGIILPKNESGISIEFQNVKFSFSNEKWVLNDINFKIFAGEKVSLQGNFGSGKSTILRLLTGAYLDFDGNILINQIPLNQISLQALRNESGILFHSQDLFQGTLLDNILLGSTSIDYAYLDKMAAIVGLKNFVNTHKEGYQFLIQPMGQHLSARLIKKVLLLRAIIHQPKLLLLEEPWLGLEEPYASQIKSYLLHEMPNTTLVIVSNDQDFSKDCDKIIVLKDGHINSITKRKNR